MRFFRLLKSPALVLLCAAFAFGQQTNPVDRRVANPITDTPNINPITQEQIAAPGTRKPTVQPEGGDGEVVVYSDSQTVEGEQRRRVVIHSANVDVRYGIYRMQADKITIIEAENKMLAEGSVVLDQGDDQRITDAMATWNYKTKLGSFED